MNKDGIKIIEWLLHELEAKFVRDCGDNAICPYCGAQNRFLFTCSDHDTFCKYRIALEYYYEFKKEAEGA